MKKTLKFLAAMAVLAGASLPAFGASPWIVENSATKEECSACHVAYAPGFLPERSWQAIMGNLTDHFGEDASLNDDLRLQITNYLTAMGPKEINGLAADLVPLRISELPWFTREHGSRVLNRVAADPNIGTISNCTACHQRAEEGRF